MADVKNAARDQRAALRRKNQTTAKSTPSQGFNSCDRESCGMCAVTYVGDLRWCELEFLAQCRRELAELLAEADGGDAR